MSQPPPNFPLPPPGGLGMGPSVPPPPAGKRRGRTVQPDTGPKPTRRLMGTQSKLAIILGILALLAVFLVLVVGRAKSTVYVVRAKVPIAAFSAIDPATQLEAVAIPKNYIEAGAITAANKNDAAAQAAKLINANARTRFPIAQGAQIHADDFTTVVSDVTTLKPNERYVTIRANASRALNGSLQTGDRVDIIGYDDGSHTAGIVASNIQIVAIQAAASQVDAAGSSQTATGSRKDLLPGDPFPGTYVVKVTTSQLPGIVAADGGSTLYLALRSATSDTSAGPPAETLQVLCGLYSTTGAVSASVALPQSCAADASNTTTASGALPTVPKSNTTVGGAIAASGG